mmetsp:Transcript_95242/g.226823  ORF Transcript_95242/g.226823 Transcript_95242/m.226823 type:complete len:311 (+) Transcript_95242:167-1099(+)
MLNCSPPCEFELVHPEQPATIGMLRHRRLATAQWLWNFATSPAHLPPAFLLSHCQRPLWMEARILLLKAQLLLPSCTPKTPAQHCLSLRHFVMQLLSETLPLPHLATQQIPGLHNLLHLFLRHGPAWKLLGMFLVHSLHVQHLLGRPFQLLALLPQLVAPAPQIHLEDRTLQEHLCWSRCSHRCASTTLELLDAPAELLRREGSIGHGPLQEPTGLRELAAFRTLKLLRSLLHHAEAVQHENSPLCIQQDSIVHAFCFGHRLTIAWALWCDIPPEALHPIQDLLDQIIACAHRERSKLGFAAEQPVGANL